MEKDHGEIDHQYNVWHLSKLVEKTFQEGLSERSIIDGIQGVLIADETLSQVFDISSQLKQKLKSKRRSKIVKIYAN